MPNYLLHISYNAYNSIHKYTLSDNLLSIKDKLLDQMLEYIVLLDQIQQDYTRELIEEVQLKIMEVSNLPIDFTINQLNEICGNVNDTLLTFHVCQFDQFNDTKELLIIRSVC
jgi:hypothetical protein